MLSPTEEIKSKLDIVDLISEYVQLKQSGANLKGLCPFHNEKTPSFMVSREKQFFKCFGCGEGGDIFTFLQKIENIEFPEALKILAEKAGVELKNQNYNPEFQNQKTRLYDINKIAAEFFQHQLLDSNLAVKARDYLINTRKLNKDIVENFLIGYAPESWDMLSKYLKTQGFSNQEILQSGLVAEKTGGYSQARNYYDRFRDRIIFTIQDHNGNIVGFTARAMKASENAKYINTPQTVIYNKSQILYGLFKAKKAIRENDFVILVEGNMDVVASHKGGVTNVVASSGTSLTIDQIIILKRYTKNLAMCFDSDNAGIKAAERGIEIALQNGMSVKVISLPDGFKDPDELVNKDPKLWQATIKQKKNFMDYIIDVNIKGKDLENIDIKRQIATKVLSWINKLIDPIEKDYYLKKLGKKIKIEEKILREALQRVVKKRTYPNYNQQNQEVKPIKRGFTKDQLVSQRLLALVFYYPDYFKELIDKVSPEILNLKYQDIYKQAIFYYTKSNEFKSEDFYKCLKVEKEQLAFVFDTLKLLAESEFLNLSKLDLNHEFEQGIKFLKKESITKKLKELEIQIQSAEQSGNRSQADELMKNFSELSHELAGL